MQFIYLIVGVRILSIDKTELLREILINEIDYLERCVEFPFGKFLVLLIWMM
jgi:hypothetical protein